MQINIVHKQANIFKCFEYCYDASDKIAFNQWSTDIQNAVCNLPHMSSVWVQGWNLPCHIFDAMTRTVRFWWGTRMITLWKLKRLHQPVLATFAERKGQLRQFTEDFVLLEGFQSYPRSAARQQCEVIARELIAISPSAFVDLLQLLRVAKGHADRFWQKKPNHTKWDNGLIQVCDLIYVACSHLHCVYTIWTAIYK